MPKEHVYDFKLCDQVKEKSESLLANMNVIKGLILGGITQHAMDGKC